MGFALHIALTFISAHAINEKPQSFHRQYIIYMLTYESWVRSPNRSPDPLDFFFFFLGGGGGGRTRQTMREEDLGMRLIVVYLCLNIAWHMAMF